MAQVGWLDLRTSSHLALCYVIECTDKLSQCYAMITAP